MSTSLLTFPRINNHLWKNIYHSNINYYKTPNKSNNKKQEEIKKGSVCVYVCVYRDKNNC